MAISSSDLNLLRNTQHKAEVYLSVFRPSTLLSAQVNDASIDRYARTITYDGGVGSVSSVMSGHTLWVGSVAGAYDVGRVRIKSITGTSTSGTITVATNSIEWTDDLYLTVKQEFGVWAVQPRFSVDPEQWWKDYDVSWTDQTLLQPPVAVAGINRAGFMSGGSVTFSLDATQSYAVYQGGSISSYQWTSTAGSIASPTSPVTSITFTTANAGGEIVTLMVTDSNGKTHTTHRVLFPHSSDPSSGEYPFTDFEITSLRGSWERGGWEASFKVRSDAGIDNFPDEALVVLWERTWYGDTEVAVSYTENVLFSGYIQKETISNDAGLKYTTFTASTVDGLLKRKYMSSIEVHSVASPSEWWEYTNNLTVSRFLDYLLRWHSTVLSVTDVIFPMSTDTRIANYFSIEAGTLYSMSSLAADRTQSKLVCNKAGVLYLEKNIQALNDTDRGTVDVAAVFDVKDRLNSLELQRSNPYEPSVAAIFASGIYYDGSNRDAFKSAAPTANNYEFYGGQVVSAENKIISGQSDLNELSGRLLAIENNVYKSIPVDFSGNYAGVVDVVPQSWWEMPLSVSDTNRGVVWDNQKLVPREIEVTFRDGLVKPRVSFEREAIGADGVTIPIGSSPPTGGTQTPPSPTNAIVTAGSSYIMKGDDAEWTEITADATNWIQIDPYWRDIQGTTSVNELIYLRCGNGYIKRSTDAGATETDVTPSIDPPNKGSDTPPPSVADLSFGDIVFDVENNGLLYVAANWMNANSNWRQWIAASSDGGITWGWNEWWLAGGVDPSDVFGAYNAKGAISYSDSLTNRNNPGVNNLITGVSPSWDASGWVFSGSEYLTTGFKPQNGMTIIFKTEPSASNYVLGENGTTSSSNYWLRYDLTIFSFYYAFGITLEERVASSAYTNFTFAFTASDTQIKVFDDFHGLTETNTAPTLDTANARNLFIGAINNGGTPTQFYTGSIEAIAIYNKSLTNAQILSIIEKMEKVF